MSTSVLIGRETELSIARAAIPRPPGDHSRVLLVGGDAGIGKTTLCSVLASEARSAGHVVLVGHCLDTTEGLPFAAVVDAVRPLVTRLSTDSERPAARRVFRLLQAGVGAELERSSLFEALRLAIEEAAQRNLVFLWLEDMHWGDQSTQDLVLALARAGPGKLVLCLTFRNEGLHPGHPFRRALVELGRCAGASRLDLRGLGVDEVTRLYLEITGEPPDQSRVKSLVERSDGNPLYVEELVGHSGGGVPATLAELFLTRLAELPEQAIELMRIASVGGVEIDPAVLGRVSGIDDADVERMLRDALEHHILRATGERLRFRHALLRDAVYDDLLPSMRNRTHGRFAAAYERRSEQRDGGPSLSELIQIAYHASSAGEPSAALVASARAGFAAQRFGAPEAEPQLRRALELWDVVEHPQELTGVHKPDLLLALARVAEFRADMDLWRDMVHRAMALITPESDPLLASRVNAARGALPDTSDPQAAGEAVERALRLAEGTGSPELARALNAAFVRALRAGNTAEALENGVRARDVAVSAGASAEEVEALVNLATLTYLRGECANGIDYLRAAVDVARRSGMLGEALLQQGHLAYYLLLDGKGDHARQVAHEARLEAVDAGLPAAAAYCGEQELECLRWAARLDDSDRILEEMLGWGMPVWRWRYFRAESLLERGDAAAALQHEVETIEDQARAVERAHDSDVVRRVRIYLMLGQVAEALEVADNYLRVIDGLELTLLHAVGARIGYQSLASATPITVAPPAELEARAARSLGLAQAADDAAWNGTHYGLQLRMAEIFALRRLGQPTLDACRRAYEVAAVLGTGIAFPPQLLYADDLLASGQREQGRVLVTELFTTATAAGARAVAEEAATIARRHRIRLDDADTTPPALLMLTPREREILDHVVTGAPNKVIAHRLGISEKTVSVHVTNLMAKLGVSTRGEAAAAKRRIDDAKP